MRSRFLTFTTCLLIGGTTMFAQTAPPSTTPPDPVSALVGRLDLEKYKATIKGLTQFGDRRQGTDRNRAAVDWIEAQLKSYGCPTERIKTCTTRRRPLPAAAGAATPASRLAADGRAATRFLPASTPTR